MMEGEKATPTMKSEKHLWICYNSVWEDIIISNVGAEFEGSRSVRVKYFILNKLTLLWRAGDRVCGCGESRAEWGGDAEVGTQRGRERKPPGSCFTEVSAVDKVFMTLGQFSADTQELHATSPLMKVS